MGYLGREYWVYIGGGKGKSDIILGYIGCVLGGVGDLLGYIGCVRDLVRAVRSGTKSKNNLQVCGEV